MLAAKTTLQHAQSVKEYLLKHNLVHPEYGYIKEMGYIYFPLLKKAAIPKAKTVNTRFSFPARLKPVTVTELLRGKLTPSELALLPQSQEIVGQILILEIPAELKLKERLIAEAYLQSHKSLITVVKKDHQHEGEFRLRKVKVLAGKNTKETIHHENGVQLKLHLENTYFSARLAHERLRIAQQVKKDEEILVMFSGAGPYLFVLVKNSPVKSIYGIEINPLAHQYALENITLNGVQSKVMIHQGDVRTILPKIKKIFDRIVMPLPKTGEEYLDIALTKAHTGTVIHLYAFLPEAEFKTEAQKIKKLCRQHGREVKILRSVKCGQFSPYVYRVCFDLKVLK